MTTREEAIECPLCHGTGLWGETFANASLRGLPRCGRCLGKGTVIVMRDVKSAIERLKGEKDD